MKIDKDHQYHGAALVQIAEDPHFTAINALKNNGTNVRNAFRINDNIDVYLKYATRPVSRYKEYRFTFGQEHLDQLKKIAGATGKLFLALVCIRGREICCLPYENFHELIERRRKAKGSDEDQYVILITLPLGKSFRAYVNIPEKKGKILGKSFVISRKDFPGRLFGANS